MSTITREFYQGSTGNVSPETRDWLNAQSKENFQSRNAEIYVLNGPYGWWIYVGGDLPATVPPDLRAIVELAVASKCDWLDLDCDTDRIESLPFYDW